MKRLDWSHFQRQVTLSGKLGGPGTVRPETEEVTDLFNHAEVYHVAPNVEICPADVSDLMARHDQELF